MEGPVLYTSPFYKGWHKKGSHIEFAFLLGPINQFNFVEYVPRPMYTSIDWSSSHNSIHDASVLAVVEIFAKKDG